MGNKGVNFVKEVILPLVEHESFSSREELFKFLDDKNIIEKVFINACYDVIQQVHTIGQKYIVDNFQMSVISYTFDEVIIIGVIVILLKVNSKLIRRKNE